MLGVFVVGGMGLGVVCVGFGVRGVMGVIGVMGFVVGVVLLDVMVGVVLCV